MQLNTLIERKALRARCEENGVKPPPLVWAEGNASRLNTCSRRDFMALSRLNLKTARAWRIKEEAQF